MQLGVDLKFFPALRDVITRPDMIALRSRNARRLEQARNTDGNVFRQLPAPMFDEDEIYPREEA